MWIGITVNDTIHVRSISYQTPDLIYKSYLRKPKGMKNAALNEMNVTFHEHSSQSVRISLLFRS